MNSLRTVGARLVTALAVFLHAPVYPDQSAATPRRAAPQRVKMGLPAFGANSIPYFIAAEKGFYREEGLEVELVLMSPAIAIAATTSGEIEFNGAAASSLGAAMQGAPVKVVLVLSNKPRYWIFGKPEIRTFADLGGRSLASGTRGGEPYIQTLLLLERFGLAGKVQVLIMPGATAQASLKSLMAGHVDAGYANETTYFALKEHGFRELINYADHLETLSSGVATSQKLIDTKPEVVRAFASASYRGMLFFKEHRSESIAAMSRRMKLDVKYAARMYDLVIGTFGGDGTVPYAPVKRELEARKSILNLAAAVPSQDELFDYRFARGLQKTPREAR